MLIVDEVIYDEGVKVYDTVSLGMQWLSWEEFAKKILKGYDCDALTYCNFDKTIRDHFGHFVASLDKHQHANDKMLIAKLAKDDEFYTRYEDIDKEMNYYNKDIFRDKVIYCCCDSEQSNFVRYFKDNKDILNYKELLYTCYADGFDFREEECVPYFKKADIVITNPPFSLFNEFIEKLYEYNLDFLILGNNIACKNKVIINRLLDDTIKIGYTTPSLFTRPNGEISKAASFWYTNISGITEKIFIAEDFDFKEDNYPKYITDNNVDIIEVSELSKIPKNYKGLMAVPITFIKRYNKKQFRILGRDLSFLYKDDILKHDCSLRYIDTDGKIKEPFERFIIQYRDGFVYE